MGYLTIFFVTHYRETRLQTPTSCQVLAATEADADTEEVPVDGIAGSRSKNKFFRKHGESSGLSGKLTAHIFEKISYQFCIAISILRALSGQETTSKIIFPTSYHVYYIPCFRWFWYVIYGVQQREKKTSAVHKVQIEIKEILFLPQPRTCF